MNLALDFVAVRIDDAHTVATNLRKVALLEINETLRDRQQRRHAACDEVLAVTEANDQRACNAADNDSIRVFGVDDQQCVGTLKPFHGLADSLDQIQPCFR